MNKRCIVCERGEPSGHGHLGQLVCSECCHYRHGPVELRVCEECRGSFEVKRADRRLCPECWRKAYQAGYNRSVLGVGRPRSCESCGGLIRGKGRRYCSDCRGASRKDGRMLGKERYHIRMENSRQRLDEFKVSMGCQVCGYRRRASGLAFHHTLPNKKSKEAARSGIKPEHFLSRKIRRALLEELASCVVICHNCHSEHHVHGDHGDVSPMGSEAAGELMGLIDRTGSELELP